MLAAAPKCNTHAWPPPPDTCSYSLANTLTNIVVGITNASNCYIYDLAGNLVTSMVNGATTVFRYNAQNKLMRIAVNTASYRLTIMR